MEEEQFEEFEDEEDTTDEIDEIVQPKKQVAKPQPQVAKPQPQQQPRQPQKAVQPQVPQQPKITNEDLIAAIQNHEQRLEQNQERLTALESALFRLRTI